MESSENCPECDAPLLNERLPGQCPECLLGLGLATPAIEVDASGHAEPQWEGTLFGGYRLVRKIARGGMGIVSQAHQEALQRDVALKMILSGRFASADELRRFRIEAEAAAGLDHPHIVPVYDVGEYENTPYLTMALVDGGNLAERMRSGEFPLGQKKVAALVKTLAEAIHHAHQRGVIHRDLKPANILFDLAGQPRIADFGLARVSNRAAEATVSSSGTPAYMAPEQVNRSTELTTAVDVHALGAILFQLLTGRPPFVASTAVETIRKVSEEEAPDPRALNRGVDFDLAVVCRKCLAKAPDDRYATAAALAEDLGRWLNGLPIEARRIPIWIRIVKWSRRRPAVAALAMLSLTLVVSLMTVLWISRGRIEERRAFAVEQQLLAEAAGDRAEREKERLGELLQRLDFEHAESHLAEGKTAEGFAYLARLHRDHPTDDIYRTRLLHALLREIRVVPAVPPWRHNGGVVRAAFSPDGEFVVTGASGGMLQVRETSSGKIRHRLVGHSGPITAIDIHPDAVRFISGSLDGTARVWNAQTGELELELKHPKAVRGIRFSPDGQWLASVAGDPQLRRWSMADGRWPMVDGRWRVGQRSSSSVAGAGAGILT